MRLTVRRTVKMSALKSKSPHCKPHTSPMRRPNCICSRRPTLRGVGAASTNSRRAACSWAEKGFVCLGSIRGSLTKISIDRIRCRWAAYLQMRRSMVKHSRDEDVPKGL